MARRFVGTSNQNLSRANAIVTGTPLTMACWARVTSTATGGAFVSINTSSASNRFSLGSNAGGTIVATANGTGSATSTGTLTVDTWAHCVGVFSTSTDRTVYLNGVATGGNGVTAIPSGLTTTLLGARRDTTIGAYLTGQLAEVAIWNVALDAAEINALNSGRVSPLSIRRANLQAYWPLGGLYGETDNDYSPNLYSLTAVNSPTYEAHPNVIYEDQYLGWNATELLPQTKVWVKAGGVWKQGIPWIKQGGVWKQGSPKIKVSGSWK